MSFSNPFLCYFYLLPANKLQAIDEGNGMYQICQFCVGYVLLTLFCFKVIAYKCENNRYFRSINVEKGTNGLWLKHKGDVTLLEILSRILFCNRGSLRQDKCLRSAMCFSVNLAALGVFRRTPFAVE